MDRSRTRWRVEDVLARTDLAELLDQLAEPAAFATRGRRWHCPVPEHDDRHASVTIHTDHRGHERWRCWSGDDAHRGDAVDLVRASQRVGRTEAVDWLALRAGLVADRPLPSVAPKKPVRTEAKREVPLDPCVVQYVQACEKILWTSTGRPVREWLNGRGFSDELLKLNHVGSDPGRTMMFRKRGLPYGGSLGATFPALDQQGDIAYVQTRYLNPGGGPKYDNPAAALAKNPRVAWTRTHDIIRPMRLVVCEGIPDALTAAGSGFRSAGVLGSQLPDIGVAGAIASAASRHGLDVLLVNDNDPAGRGWAQRLLSLLEGEGVHASLAEPPDVGMDLNNWSSREPSWASAVSPELSV